MSGSAYKYHIHPFFKLVLLICFNLFAFMPLFQAIRAYLLIGEIGLALIIRLQWALFWSFFKFILLSFIGLFILFYFVEFSIINALELFGSYVLTILILFLGVFIFSAVTPLQELLVAFDTFRIPQGLSIAITIALCFFPILTQNFREILIYQQARGYHLRIRNLWPVLIPGLMSILDLSINMTLSLESRGFGLKN